MRIKSPSPGSPSGAIPSAKELVAAAFAGIKAKTPDMHPSLWRFTTANRLTALSGAVPSLAELQALGAALSEDTSLPFDYLTDGCVQRAQSMGAIIEAHGFNCATLDITAADADLAAANAHMAASWFHHVAPCVFARHPDTDAIEAFIVDPSMRRDAPVMSIAEWLADFATNTRAGKLVMAPLTPFSDESRATLKTFAETFDHFAREPTANFESHYKRMLYSLAYGAQTLPTKRDFVLHNYVAARVKGDPANAYRLKPRDGSQRYQAVVTEADAKHATISDFNFAATLPEADKTSARQQLLAHLSIGKEVVRTPEGRVNLAQIPATDPLTHFVRGERSHQCWPVEANPIGRPYGVEQYAGYCRSVPAAGAYNFLQTVRRGNAVVVQPVYPCFTKAEMNTYGQQAAKDMGWPCERVIVESRFTSAAPGYLEKFLRDHVELAVSGARYPLAMADGSTRVTATLEIEQSFNVRDVVVEPGIPPSERDRVVRSMARYGSLLQQSVFAPGRDRHAELWTESVVAAAGHTWIVAPKGDNPTFRATFIGGMATPAAGQPAREDANQILIKELWFADTVTAKERTAILKRLTKYLMARGWGQVADVSNDPVASALLGDIAPGIERLDAAPVRPAEDLYAQRRLVWFDLDP